MYKTSSIKTDNKIMVDINELQGMLSIGRHTAKKMAEEAGAVVRIGRRKLYNIEKVKIYIDSLTGQEVNA